jgi:hypothetical protein
MKSHLKHFFIGLFVVIGGVAVGATFNLFQPATGILKGNASTYVTTAATSSDLVATFTGTCNNGTYLRGDGTCNTPPGTGVSSVGLTMPSGFSVGGSPVTSSGTLAVSTTLNGVVHGDGSGLSASNVLLGSEVTGTLPVANGGTGAATLTGVVKGNGTSPFTAGAVSLTAEVSGTLPVGNGGSGVATLTGVLHGNGTSPFTAANVALGTEVSGTLPVANGGTGAATLTGLLKGNGTSAFTAATSSDVITLWTGTCNSSSFLRGDGACAAAGAGSVTSVGLTMPSGFSVSGSPVTGSGTLAVSTTLNGPLRGNGSAFTTGNIALGSEVSGTLGVSNGGTGVTSSTGSGSVVLSASPTFTGTVTAATVAATAVTVGGNAVCQSTGTNCPSTPTLGGSNTWTGTNNFTVGGLFAFGSPVLTFSSYASSFVNSAGGCTSPSNISACTRNSQGDYTLTLNPGISSAKCTASVDTTSATPPVRIAYTHTNSFTSVGVIIADGSTNKQDANFNVVCWG